MWKVTKMETHEFTYLCKKNKFTLKAVKNIYQACILLKFGRETRLACFCYGWGSMVLQTSAQEVSTRAVDDAASKLTKRFFPPTFCHLATGSSNTY